MAVGDCARHGLRTDIARCARPVVNDHLLAEFFSHVLHEKARERIRVSAGRVAKYQRYRPLGVCIFLIIDRRGGTQWQGSGQQRKGREISPA
jgi:hypothetical protein